MDRIPKQRDIIDRKALSAMLDERAYDTAPDQLRNLIQGTLVDALAAGTEEIGNRLRGGQNGRQAAAARSFLVDQMIRLLFDFTLTWQYPITNPTSSEHLCIAAVGGYGRGELAPFSDIDLLFLLPYKQTAWGEQVVESMLYVLWDLGLKVGYSVRSVDDCLSLSRDDLTIRTALLESRYIWGDQELFNELKVRFDNEVVADSGALFVDRKLAERDERHERMGDSRYVVEPNLKDGKGGLRDLQTLYWIMKYVYRTDDVRELVRQGVLTEAEQRRFSKAENFLWTVRCHLHDLAGRPEERLTFDKQTQLAERLNYVDRPGISGVERFMRHYFLTAKDVGDLTRIFCAWLEDQHQKKSLLRMPRFGLRKRQVDSFGVDGDRINFISDGQIVENPVDILRLFQVAQQQDYDIHPNALRLITQNLNLINAKLRKDPAANAIFIDILTSKTEPAKALRRMNEAGVFGRFVPDFGRVVAQMQHDMYHHYTVDEHTIRAIDILSQVEAGEMAEDHPTLDRIIHQVLSRRVLYVAVLLHDIAKGRGGDHSILGAEVAEKLCPRFGFSDAETETVAWLVRSHLDMSNTAFKRDLADPKTGADFAEIVQSVERLRLLVCLTVADIRAVGPGVWNGWKGQLLRDLYYITHDHLTDGVGEEGMQQRAQIARDSLRGGLLGWSDERYEKYIARHSDVYWISTPLDVGVRDAKLISKADEEKDRFCVATHSDDFTSKTQLTLYTVDHPGLFARVAGALAVAGASIVDAKIFTTKDGMALDHFTIQDKDGEAFSGRNELDRLEKILRQTMAGDIIPRQVLSKPEAIPSRARKVFTVTPSVLIDNNASDSHTVIEVTGRDRAGFVSDVTRALFDLKLSISSAQVATWGERAVDTFYVRDLFGHKVTHESRFPRIEERIIDGIRNGELQAEGKSAKKAGEEAA
jgi:[protein-PII] uridylyltransferase